MRRSTEHRPTLAPGTYRSLGVKDDLGTISLGSGPGTATLYVLTHILLLKEEIILLG